MANILLYFATALLGAWGILGLLRALELLLVVGAPVMAIRSGAFALLALVLARMCFRKAKGR